MLGDPKNLKKHIQIKEPENQQLSVLETNKFEVESIEYEDTLSDHQL